MSESTPDAHEPRLEALKRRELLGRQVRTMLLQADQQKAGELETAIRTILEPAHERGMRRWGKWLEGPVVDVGEGRPYGYLPFRTRQNTVDPNLTVEEYADADYLNALEAENADLKAKAERGELLDLVLNAIRGGAEFEALSTLKIEIPKGKYQRQYLLNWLADYDAVKEAGQ